MDFGNWVLQYSVYSDISEYNTVYSTIPGKTELSLAIGYCRPAAPAPAAPAMSAPQSALGIFGARLEERPGRGRVLVAEKDMPAGHLCLRNQPFTRVLRPALWDQRCFACFGLLKEQAIQSSCVWYCSPRCQQVDYLINHAVEGPLLGRLRDTVQSDDVLSDMILVARTLRRVHGGSDGAAYSLLTAGANTPTTRNSKLPDPIRSEVQDVLALVYHEPSDMSSVLEVARNVIESGLLGNAVHAVSGAKEVATMLLRFGCNNFAVTSNLLVTIGAAVCPAGAILNHSCQPNCAVTWDPVTGAQEIRCVSAVSRGTELTHSYVDSASPTTSRRTRLRNDYGFLCDCVRCTMPTLVKLAPAFRMELLAASRACIAAETVTESEKAEKIEQPGTLDTCGDQTDQAGNANSTSAAVPESMGQAADRLASSADHEWDIDACMVGDILGRPTDGATGSLGAYQCEELARGHALMVEASTNGLDAQGQLDLLKTADRIFVRWLHPLNLDRLKVTNEMLTVALAAGDYKTAVAQVRRAIVVYDHLYGTSYAHPMVGLQAYTLGNLYYELQRCKEAVACLERSVGILRSTHGRSSELVEGLSALLQQAKKTGEMLRAMQRAGATEHGGKGRPGPDKKKSKKKKGKKKRSGRR